MTKTMKPTKLSQFPSWATTNFNCPFCGEVCTTGIVHDCKGEVAPLQHEARRQPSKGTMPSVSQVEKETDSYIAFMLYDGDMRQAEQNAVVVPPSTKPEYSLNAYQSDASRTNNQNAPMTYYLLGLTGEAGELANIGKRFVRDGLDGPTEEQIGQLADEMGDCLWYISQLAAKMGLTLQEVAKKNVEKLAIRYAPNGGYFDMGLADAHRPNKNLGTYSRPIRFVRQSD